MKKRILELMAKYNDGCISREIFTKVFKCITDSDVKYFSSHGIRFHNISAMYDAGISEKEIQRMSGHTTAMMTRHYNKIISTVDESAKIRAILG